jgi:hypothetical protein
MVLGPVFIYRWACYYWHAGTSALRDVAFAGAISSVCGVVVRSVVARIRRRSSCGESYGSRRAATREDGTCRGRGCLL